MKAVAVEVTTKHHIEGVASISRLMSEFSADGLDRVDIAG